MPLFRTRTVRFPAASREWPRNSPSQTRHSHIRNYDESTEPTTLFQFPPLHTGVAEHWFGKSFGRAFGSRSSQTTARTEHDPEARLPASQMLFVCWHLLRTYSPSSC